MPYYSDNLYSADDSDDDAQRYYHGGVEEEDDDAAAEAAAGHVSDGFFHASDPQYDTGSSSPLWAGVQSSPPASGGPAPDSSSSSGHNDNEQPWSTTSDHNGQRQWTAPMSAQVPFVPNILIPDPSLEQREQLSRAESKAAEARLESQGLYNRPQAPHAEPPAAPTTPRRTPYSPPSHPPTGAGSNGQPGPSSYLSDNHTYAATQQGYRGYQSHHQPTSGHYRQVSASSSGTLARDLYYGHGRQPSAAGAGVVDIPEIQAGEAPPAYTPSPTTTAGSTAAATLSPQSTGPSAARPPGVAIGYNTFTPVTTTSSGSSGAGNENGADLEAHAYRNGSSAMGQIDEEWRALLGGGHEPQSLSRPSQDGLGRNSDEYEQAPLLWRRKVAGSRARRFCRGCCKALLVFVLVTMVLGSIVSLLQELGDDLVSRFLLVFGMCSRSTGSKKQDHRVGRLPVRASYVFHSYVRRAQQSPGLWGRPPETLDISRLSGLTVRQ